MTSNDLKTFIISQRIDGAREVIGYVCHINGDRAADKAEDVTGFEGLTWTAWENATPAQRKQADVAGNIT